MPLQDAVIVTLMAFSYGLLFWALQSEGGCGWVSGTVSVVILFVDVVLTLTNPIYLLLSVCVAAGILLFFLLGALVSS